MLITKPQQKVQVFEKKFYLDIHIIKFQNLKNISQKRNRQQEKLSENPKQQTEAARNEKKKAEKNGIGRAAKPDDNANASKRGQRNK